jgi:hypothetical protein
MHIPDELSISLYNLMSVKIATGTERTNEKNHMAVMIAMTTNKDACFLSGQRIAIYLSTEDATSVHERWITLAVCMKLTL